MIRIETNRLILRPLTDGDFSDLLQYHSDPDTVRFIPWPVRTPEDVRDAIEKYKVFPDFSQDGDTLILGWELEETGQVIGQSNFTISSVEHQKGPIGYVIHPDFVGRGYAFEASRAFIDHVFATINVRKLFAVIEPRNSRSVALIERLGFRLEGTFIEDEFFKGEWSDTSFYALRRTEHEDLDLR